MTNGNAAQRRKEKRTQQPPNAIGVKGIPEEHNTKNETRNLQNEQGEQDNMWQWLKKWFPTSAVWTAIFTAILTIFTGEMYRVSNITSQIQRISQRAFLTFSGPTLGARMVDPSGGWNGQEVGLNWANNGETPARQVFLETNAFAFYPDIPEEYDFPLSPTAHVVIGPKSVYGATVNVPRDAISDAARGKKRIFAWGDVLYKDAFPNSPVRLTEFCVEFTHLTFGTVPAHQPNGPVNPMSDTNPNNINVDSPDTALMSFQWQQCRAHNCYDEDCPDYEARIKDIGK